MLADESPSLLEAEGIVSGYRGRPVLRGVSITIREGEMVALVGHNGSGKSTLLKSLFGLVPIMGGEVRLKGERIVAPSPRSLLRAGIAYMPQGQRAFDNLTVAENLEIAASLLPRPLRAAAVEGSCALFSDLEHVWRRKCRRLSGGERQMVALAAALITSPRLLLLDEPTLGLAPQPASQLLLHLCELNTTRGVAMLIVEQRIRAVLAMSQKAYVMKNGQVAHAGAAGSLAEKMVKQIAFDGHGS